MSTTAPDPQPAAPEELPPRRSRRATLAVLAVVAALVVLDLWSKNAAFAWFADPAAQADFDRTPHGHRRYVLVGDWLGFMENENYGAAFGQGESMPWLLVGGRCLAAILLTVLIVRMRKGQPVYLTSLVLILAGALGNLYDNFFYRPPHFDTSRPFGPVRDFIDVYFARWDWHFPTFNVADSCITVGAVFLLASSFFGHRREPQADPRREPEEEPQNEPHGAPVSDAPSALASPSAGGPERPERQAPTA